MKKLIISLMIAALPILGSAQSFRFAYLSYDKVMKAMPEYAAAMHNLESLKAQYDGEIKRTEDDFNNKYEEFLEVQNTLAPSIRNKRQVELQDLMNRGIAFKDEAERLLKQATGDALMPVRQKLDSELAKYGKAQGYAFILNGDNQALPFVNDTYGEDITEEMISKLR